MPRYTTAHHEDVAGILASYTLCKLPDRCESCHNHRGTVMRFADLFAADNPPVCEVGSNHGPDDICGPACLRGGFDRAEFLRACGIEP